MDIFLVSVLFTLNAWFSELEKKCIEIVFSEVISSSDIPIFSVACRGLK